jgi:hypothetical protein
VRTEEGQGGRGSGEVWMDAGSYLLFGPNLGCGISVRPHMEVTDLKADLTKQLFHMGLNT